jgi:phosphate transport system permease protein
VRIHPRHTQRLAVGVLGAATLLTLAVLAFIIVFVLKKGLPTVTWAFLSGMPQDMGRAGGILPTIVASAILPLLALVVAVPLGIGTAVYLAEYTRESRFTRTVRFGTDCLAGVPSIIFGLFGFIFFVILLGMGWSLLAGGLTLGIMVLPTVIRTAEEAIRAVPTAYREVSCSMGATPWQTVWHVVLPNALPGILTGVMLSVARCLEETAVIYFTAGTALRLPASLFDSARPMSVHFYLLAREGLSNENAYGTAAVLILAVLAVNLTAYWSMHAFLRRRARKSC